MHDTQLALSVRQPFAEQIASGKKKMEYRSWTTRHRGPLLICASAQVHDSIKEKGGKALRDALALPLGKMVCVVDVVDVVWDEDEDCYAWKLRNPRRVVGEPVKGCASFYRVPKSRIYMAPVGHDAR